MINKRQLTGVIFAAVLAGMVGTVGAQQMGPYMGPGMMGPYMGPGMMGPYMGPGMMGPYMGPGMMGPYMGPGMMGPYMGPGMTGPYAGGGMGPGMMGPGMMGPGVGPGNMGPNYMGPGVAPGNYYGLDLSEDQRNKIAAIQEQARKEQWNLMTQMREEQYKLQELYYAQQPDPSAINAQAGKIEQLQRKMVQANIDAQKQVESVLTPEQREQLQRWNRNRAMWGYQ
jgi:Spy/CpxP family protein refolding chaperone